LSHKNFSSTWKEHDSELQSLTDISTEIAALEHEKLGADMVKKFYRFGSYFRFSTSRKSFSVNAY
jgi:hypothetical protein